MKLISIFGVSWNKYSVGKEGLKKSFLGTKTFLIKGCKGLEVDREIEERGERERKKERERDRKKLEAWEGTKVTCIKVFTIVKL